MLIIGLTGGIGSGKSTAAQLFANKNIPIIDTDTIARTLTTRDSPALEAIVQHFGPDILQADQTLNRKKLREIIFKNQNERQWLEKLLHPLIRAEMRRQIALYKAPYCIVVIPLLTESTPDPIIQRILVIDATKAQQMARTKKRDELPAETVSAIFQAQSSREKKIHLADDIIDNSGTIDDLATQINALHQTYLSLAKNQSIDN